MASFNQGGQKPILQRCSEINNGVSEVESKLNRIAMLQKRSLSESGNSATKQELDALTEETMAQYRKLTQQVREVKSDPASGQSMNASQVRFVEKRLRDAIQKYQELESGYRTETRNQVERQFRIVRPDATDAEVREAVENSSSDQVFQQALMRNARQAQANEVLGAVRQRHQEMLEIEKRLGELLDLMQDMQVLLAKQEVTIAQIDTQAEQAAEDMVKANEQLESAVVTARKTRKKKWICLGICGTSSFGPRLASSLITNRYIQLPSLLSSSLPWSHISWSTALRKAAAIRSAASFNEMSWLICR
jgi:syntaxin 1B/2/3